jgi:hypothetical protein
MASGDGQNFDIRLAKDIELGDSINDNSYATLTITAKKDNGQSYYMWEPTLTFYKLDVNGTVPSPESGVVLSVLDNNGFVGLVIQNATNITKSSNDYTYTSAEKQSSVSLQFNAAGIDSLVDKVIWLKFTCKKRNGATLTDKWCKVTFIDQAGGLTDVQFDWT